jgi:hypothetical protein
VENVEAVNVGLNVGLEARTGREEEVESFLREALRLVHDERATPLRFAARLDPSTFAIIDAFPDDKGGATGADLGAHDRALRRPRRQAAHGGAAAAVMPTRIVFQDGFEITVFDSQDDVVPAMRRDHPSPVRLRRDAESGELHVNWDLIRLLEPQANGER